MIYLSTQGRDTLDESRSVENYELATACLIKLLKAGYKVVCPSVSDRVIFNHGLTEGWDSEGLRDELIKGCSGVIIVMSERWQADATILHDIRCATKYAKPTFYLEPDEFADNPKMLYCQIVEEMSHAKHLPKDAPAATPETACV